MTCAFFVHRDLGALYAERSRNLYSYHPEITGGHQAALPLRLLSTNCPFRAWVLPLRMGKKHSLLKKIRE